MRFRKKASILVYLLCDYLTAGLAWAGLFFYRKIYIQEYEVSNLLELTDHKFFYGITLVPLFWLALYFVTGTYRDIYRKSRLNELYKTFFITIFGVIVLFFALMLDDFISNDYTNYYKSVGILFSLHFILTSLFRVIQLTLARRRLIKGTVSYNTIIIGGNQRAVDFYKELNGSKKTPGFRFLGFVDINGNNHHYELASHIPRLGHLRELPQVIAQNDVEEVIIAIETSEHPLINQIINALAGEKVIIRIIPDMYDILSGSVKMTHVIGAVLIEIYPDLMPFWQKIIKRLIDTIVAAIMLVLLTPLFIYIAIRVKLSSPGPILYSQQRVGRKGKPYRMYKFRSMYTTAEANGPALSSANDPRVTPWGRVMRKWRFDELPQFYNVLRGEMSLVGPRPERQYFIDKIVERAPAYRHLQKVKPGITSWGMVKFGYAENVDEMIKRMEYDLLYIENMSLAIDFKIMIYTGLIILQGKGK